MPFPRRNLCLIFAIIAVLTTVSFLSLENAANAQTTDELQSKIDDRNTSIKALEKEIAGYQKQIDDLGGQADSLAATIKSLDLTQKKLQADIKVTENKIDAKNDEIKSLSAQIGDKEESIGDDKRVIAHSLALLAQTDSRSLVELVLSKDSISSAFNAVDDLGAVQNRLLDRIGDLKQDKVDLEANKAETEKAKTELEKLKKQLNDQRQVVLNTQSEKNDLLKETKQSESQYKKLMTQRQAQKEAFEKEVLQLESQLQLTVNVSKLPKTGSGVLSWPTDKVYITQYFGNTPFATANSQVYGGKGHNGIDLRASIGTPIRASLSGTVVGISNTDAIRGCYSYGKWVMVEHANGLSTLYAHLSVQSVSKGQTVSTGQIIGYSGNTGYTTGPHLHFGVYATEGVQIRTLTAGQSRNCTGATIPVADFKAYLNPLSYL